jgi:deferrochelatase/peroxidase EfeB
MKLSHVLRELKDDPNTCGSFLVFRKLEQNVARFQREVDKLARVAPSTAGATPSEVAGAAVIGRFKDGTPLMLGSCPGLGPRNDFDYRPNPASTTPDDSRCPFHAHIRKVNPRGDPAFDENAVATRDRQPTRRSIPYGKRALNNDRVLMPEDELPEKDVGLLFMAFVKDISLQFERIMTEWAANHDFPVNNAKADPVIGRAPGETSVQVNWPKPPNSALTDFAASVIPKGGAYFFAPPRSFFEKIVVG